MDLTWKRPELLCFQYMFAVINDFLHLINCIEIPLYRQYSYVLRITRYPHSLTKESELNGGILKDKKDMIKKYNL